MCGADDDDDDDVMDFSAAVSEPRGRPPSVHRRRLYIIAVEFY